MTGPLKLLACQIDVPTMASPADRDRHLDRIAALLEDMLRTTSVDLVVLPELSSLDYGRQTFERLADFAEPLQGPTFESLRGIARRFDVAIVYGIPRRGDGVYHISQVAIGPDGGILGHYDKLHIAQYGASCEKEFFARGNRLFVFEHRGLRIAPIICYDIRVPELSRTLALDQRIDLLLHCGAYARDESFHSWHAFVVARAMENQVYVLSLNRAGEDFGQSLFCSPWVDEEMPAVTFPETAESLLSLDVDPARVRDIRARYSFLKDRLPDYSTLGGASAPVPQAQAKKPTPA